LPNVPWSPGFPPQRFTARYELGFETDREALAISEQAWDFVYRGVENYILCDPYKSPPTWEIADSGGARFLVTTDVPYLNVPPLVVYFKPDETTRRVAFLTVERVPETPSYVDFDWS
jgi:hypothetical protein